MTNQPNDGGPAFPTHGNPDTFTSSGMSLRDWFAGMAMQGILASSDNQNGGYVTLEAMASDAWKTADAMLKAREQ